MQEEKKKVYFMHTEIISVPFEAGLDVLQTLFRLKDEDELSKSWFEFLDEESTKMLRENLDAKIKNQITLLREIARYCYNSALTEGLYGIHLFPNSSELDLEFAFKNHEDATEFLNGLDDFIETL